VFTAFNAEAVPSVAKYPAEGASRVEIPETLATDPTHAEYSPMLVDVQFSLV
jgi:hypothetical protein